VEVVSTFPKGTIMQSILSFFLILAAVYWSLVAYKETDKHEQNFAMLLATLYIIAARIGS
jgi:prolipoprotein diacylglyceryltransferase